MKSIQIGLFAFSTLCAAQLGNLPSCAKPCASSLPASCQLTDVKCICSDQSFITGISCCVEKACSPSDQTQTLKVAAELCDTVQVTLPSAASCPASAAPSGTSSAAAAGQGTASSAVSAATMQASSVASGGQSTASSAMSMMSNTAATAGSATSSATGSSTGTPTSSTATSATSAKAATGAAQVFGSNVGAVGAAVAALILL